MSKISEYKGKAADLISEKLNSKIDSAVLESPPNPDMGDIAFPCFSLAKLLKKSPAQIASEIAAELTSEFFSNIKATGPYINFFINQSKYIEDVFASDDKIAKEEKTILIESPGPNSNKPLHIGHLRNMLLGQSLTKIQKARGYNVKAVNIVNDKGIHISKSILAYMKWGEGKTPESENIKPDHFVGSYYVLYNTKLKENPDLEKELNDINWKWEKSDPEVRKVWKQMNKWCIKGQYETYESLNLKIDKEYYESDIYLKAREIIDKGLKEGIFKLDENENVVLDLEDKGLGTKVLLRADGTTVYITQDIYLALLRYQEFKFDYMYYVVGSEQDYHFKVLFEIFKLLKYEFANNCIHYSYGHVLLTEGRLKSREGNVIESDELISEVIAISKNGLVTRNSDLSEEELNSRASAIGLAAIRFFFLKFEPKKDFTYNPEESLSFEGETGPYLLYTYARINTILKNSKPADIVDLTLLSEPLDKEIAKIIDSYNDTVISASKNYNPSIICHYLFDLAQNFNSWYAKYPVLKADEKVKQARLVLLQKVKQTLQKGLLLLDITPLEQM